MSSRTSPETVGDILDALPPTNHNGGPSLDPIDGFAKHIDDLMDEAKGHLDGEAIASEVQAEAVAKLLDELRKTGKDADQTRATEKKPHDDAAKAVQARWKPLLSRVEMAQNTCKQALGVWLRKKDDDLRAKAEAERIEAERIRDEAQRAHAAADPGDLAAREEAEALLQAASDAEAQAKRADKAAPRAKGGSRAVGLRSVWSAVVIDRRALLNHYAKMRPDDLAAWLHEQAQADVRAGLRSIPGCEIKEEKVAV